MPVIQDAALMGDLACDGRRHLPRFVSEWKKKLGHKPWRELLGQRCKACSLHVLVSDGVLLPGVEPHRCGCVGLVMDPAGVGSTGQEHSA